MKPGIVNIIYFVLGLLIVGGALQVSAIFEQNFESGYSAIYNASGSLAILIASIVAIYSLKKRLSWSRPLSFTVVRIQSLLTIGTGVYFAIASKNVGAAMLIPYLSYGIPLLFLAYKIFSSKPLKEYLANA